MSAYLTWLTSTIDDALSGTIKALLVDSTYVPSTTDEFRADITGEVTGTGYTAGGVTVAGVTVTQVDPVVKIDFTDLSFGTIDVTEIAGIVLYVSTGSSATDVLIGADFFTPATTSGGAAFTYRPHADGFLVVTAP